MKTTTIVALSSFLALVSATPLAKRAMVVETVVEDVTMTVDTTTTVWVKPTPAPEQHYQQPAPVAQKHGYGHQHLHSHAPAAPAPKAPSPAPVAPAPKPVAPAPVYQAPKAATPAPVAQAPKAAAPVYQPPPTTTSTPAPAYTPPPSPAPAPQPTTAAPAPSPSESSSSSSGATGGACGTVGGTCTGDITYYTAGLGACGWTNDGSTEDVFALAHGMMGDQSNGNPYCGRMASIKVPGKPAVTAKLVDKCMGCDGESIDLSTHLFDQLCAESVGRLHDVQWHFIS